MLVGQWRSVFLNPEPFINCMLYAGLPRSMHNADKCRSKFWHWSQFRSIPINVLLMPWSGIDRNWEELRGIDRHWLAMIGIERHFGSMPWFWSALISIDRHWAMIEGVLYMRYSRLTLMQKCRGPRSPCKTLMVAQADKDQEQSSILLENGK